MDISIMHMYTLGALVFTIIVASLILLFRSRKNKLNLGGADIELYNGIKVYTHGIKQIQPIDMLRLNLYTSEWIAYQLKIDPTEVVAELAKYDLHFYADKKTTEANRKKRAKKNELHIYYPGNMANSTFFPMVVNLIYSKFDIFKEKERCLNAINTLRSGYYS
jgi:hypothetical protein